NTMLLLDPLTFRTKVAAPGYVLTGVADTGAGGRRILAQQSAAGEAETIAGAPVLQFRVDRGRFVPTGWSTAGTLIRDLRWFDPRAELDYPGPRVLTFDVDGDGVRDLLLRRGDTIVAIDPESGAILRTFRLPAGATMDAAFLPRFGRDTRLAVTTNRSSGVLLDTNGIAEVVTCGGSHLQIVPDGHMREPAITADLDGDGINEIYLTTSANEIVRLRADRGVLRAETLLSASGLPRLLALTDPNDRGLIVGGVDRDVFLRRLAVDGHELWSVPRSAEMTNIVGLNSGRFGESGRRGIVAAGGPWLQMPTSIHDAASG